MVITSVMMLKQKRIARAFEHAGALAVATARTPDQLGVTPGLAWHRLVTHGVLRCPGEGRYFLDVAKWQQLRRLRKRIAIAVIGSLLVVLVVIVLATRPA